MLSRLMLSQGLLLCVWTSLHAQTVQLPTFNFTTVNTTVTVPDGGSALLGGIKRASTGSVERGVPVLGKVPGLNRLFRNRAMGQEYSSSMMHARTRIVILDEMDQEILGQAAQSRAARGDYRTFDELAAQRQADSLRRQLDVERRHQEYQASARLDQYLRTERQRIAQSQSAQRVNAPQSKPALPDVNQVRQKNAQARQERDAEALAYLQKGQAAEQAGKFGAARVYYGMALRRARAELKESIQSRLNSLQSAGGSTAGGSTAGGSTAGTP